MTEQEQYKRLAAGFAKLDNDRRNSLEEYTRALAKTCRPGKRAGFALKPGDEKAAPKGEMGCLAGGAL